MTPGHKIRQAWVLLTLLLLGLGRAGVVDVVEAFTIGFLTSPLPNISFNSSLSSAALKQKVKSIRMHAPLTDLFKNIFANLQN